MGNFEIGAVEKRREIFSKMFDMNILDDGADIIVNKIVGKGIQIDNGGHDDEQGDWQYR